MTNNYLSRLYDRSTLIAELLESAGAKIRARGSFVDTKNGNTHYSNYELTIDEYVTCTELPELLCPSARKVETTETDVDGIGSMVTYTSVTYDDSVDTDYFEIIVDTESDSYDGFAVRKIRDAIKALDVELDCMLLSEFTDGNIQIGCTASYTPNDELEIPTATSFEKNVPAPVYLADAVQTHAEFDGCFGIEHVDRTYVFTEDTGWTCSKVCVCDVSRLYPPVQRRLGLTVLRQYFTYEYSFTALEQPADGSPAINTTYPNWCRSYDSMRDALMDSIEVYATDERTGEIYPLVYEYAYTVGARPY